MQTVKDALREIRRYPSAIAGLLIVLMLVVLSIYVVIAIPYREAITLWRGGEGTWRSLPRTVPPAWINTFRSQKLPETIDLDSRKGAAERQETPLGEGKSVTLLYTFDYQADDFPREINIFFETSYKERAPFASITWYTPDGREIAIADLGPAGRFHQLPLRSGRQTVAENPATGWGCAAGGGALCGAQSPGEPAPPEGDVSGEDSGHRV
jgi:hypothetical protein